MKTVERVLIISGEDAWVDATLARCLVGPDSTFYRAAYGYIQEVSRRIIAETPGGNGAFEASEVGPTPTSVAKIGGPCNPKTCDCAPPIVRCPRCHGSGMIAYWDGSALAGEMCPDCDSPDVGPDVPGGGANP